MKKIETELNDCYILEPQRFGDERGYFEAITIEDLNNLSNDLKNSLATTINNFSN